MLNIVIIGAGDIGRYIAAMLSKDQHNIILIDHDRKKLEEASWNLDVAIRHGSGTNWQLLEDIMELSPDVLIALTNNDEVNLTSCTIAKHLGYPKTIARVKDERYLNRSRLDFAQLFDVDHFVGPDLLVANDIMKYMQSSGAVAVEHFAHGAVQMRTVNVPSRWRRFTTPLKDLKLNSDMLVGLIARQKEGGVSRGRQVIFPRGEDCILPGDEVTFIGQRDAISDVQPLLGLEPLPVGSVVIIGGTLTAVHLTRMLKKHDIEVRIVEKNYKRCCELNEILPETIIMNHEPTDFDFLNAEEVGTFDAIVCCTEDDEVNFMAALLGKEAGCRIAIVMMSNMNYAALAVRMGITHTVSPRLSAANHILSQILSGTVTSLISLYDNQAEIMEINVSLDSKLVGIPLAELRPLLPRDFLIAMIQNRGRIMIAGGNRVISPGDTVIVITSPKHVHELEKIF